MLKARGGWAGLRRIPRVFMLGRAAAKEPEKEPPENEGKLEQSWLERCRGAGTVQTGGSLGLQAAGY